MNARMAQHFAAAVGAFPLQHFIQIGLHHESVRAVY
jgi:hypothetical protein